MMGYIGENPDRAAGWWNHQSPERSFCPAKTAVEGSFKYLEIEEQGEHRVAAVNHEYTLYHHLCMAKHVNPIAERTRYIGIRAGAMRLTLTPHTSWRRIREARMGLILVCRAAIMAIWVFHKANGAPGAEDPRLNALVQRTASLLGTWKAVDEEADEPQATPPIR